MSFLGKLFGRSTNKSGDDQVRLHLLKAGDDGSKPRIVDHFAYFSTDENAREFIEFIVSAGYSLGESTQEFGVVFQKESIIASPSFDAELQILSEKSKQLKGEYDGWGSPITK